MSATKNRGVSGLEFAVTQKAVNAVSIILAGGRSDDQTGLEALDTALQGFLNRQQFTATGEVLKPTTFAEFLKLSSPTQGMFNQLASETAWWTLLDQIEEVCFGNEIGVEQAWPFLSALWQKEVAQKPLKSPKDRRYLPVATAVEVYRNIFGASLKADAVISAVRAVKSRSDSEGIAVWPKLSTLWKLFSVSGNPLDPTDEGRTAYARIVELFIPQVGKAYLKAHGKEFQFANWREGALTWQHIVLTPAGRKTWQFLEAQTDDDFCFSPMGAISGASYAGFSHRFARLQIASSADQMPQDCIMTGATLASQPDWLCKGEHLSIDNPGNAYSPDADGEFGYFVRWGFFAVDRRLGFDREYAGYAFQNFGSAVLLRSVV